MDIQRFTIISQHFSEFWLVVSPTVASRPPSAQLCPPWLKPVVTPLVVGDGCLVHQLFVTNLTAAETKLAEMQKNLALKSFSQYHSKVNFWQQVPDSKYPEYKRPVCYSFLCVAQQIAVNFVSH